MNAVLLKPLPYAEPERLVRIVENVPAEESFGGGTQRRTSLNVAELDEWRKSRTLSHIAIVSGLEGHTLGRRSTAARSIAIASIAVGRPSY